MRYAGYRFQRSNAIFSDLRNPMDWGCPRERRRNRIRTRSEWFSSSANVRQGHKITSSWSTGPKSRRSDQRVIDRSTSGASSVEIFKRQHQVSGVGCLAGVSGGSCTYDYSWTPPGTDLISMLTSVTSIESLRYLPSNHPCGDGSLSENLEDFKL